ncbi:MAG: alpha,6-mannosyltransferase [Actinomycetota bacterium]|nr:alpha,6-mannosyltransferase [Actinomycetota bacterium]
MRTARGLRYALLVAATAAELVLLQLPRHSVSSVLLVIVAGGTGGALVVLEYRSSCLRLLPVACMIGLVVFASVSVPPRTSSDLWSYAMYGRMVTVYDKSPYDHVPAEFRRDPFEHRVSPRWRHRASVYGPLFVGVSALGALTAGPSVAVMRLFFQLLAALAFAATLVLVWRTTRSMGALLFLGLNPVLAVIVVNGGHNDALVGLAILAAVLFAAKRNGGAAGALIGLAALVKLTAGLALIGLVIWAFRHRRQRLAVTATIVSGAVVAVGYLPVLASASHVLGEADRTVTNGSPWNGLVDLLLHHDAWRNVPNPLAPNDTLTAVFYLGAALVLAVGATLAWAAGTDPRPEPAVGVAVAAYPMAAEYAYPWYGAWALPVFAGRRLTALSAVVWLESVAVLAALKLPLQATGPPVQSVLRVVLTDVVPPLLLVAFVVAALREFPLRRRVPLGAGTPVLDARAPSRADSG